MATTYNDNGGSVNGSNKNFTFTFPYLKTQDVKVSLNGLTQATTKYTVNVGVNPTRIEFNNNSVDSTVQESSGAPKTGVTVRVYRDTDVDSAKAVYAAGSSIRAQNLNDNQDQVLYALQEEQNQPENITDADINASAEIQVSKLKDGTARQVLQTASNGTDVEWTSNVDLPGTLDVTSNAQFDGNVDITGTTTVGGTVNSAAIVTGPITGQNNFGVKNGAGGATTFFVTAASGNTDIDGTLTVGGTVNSEHVVTGAITGSNNLNIKNGTGGATKFFVQASNGNTTVDGSLTVGATTTITGVTTVNNLLDVNGQAIIDNVRLNGNEIDTTEGGLTIDSATGTVTVDDNLTINGTVDTDTLVVSGTSTQATVDINGGAIDGTTIGSSSASSGAFTSLTASSTTTVNSTLDVNGLATVDNVRLDGNEIDTTEGNLILDSATGTVTINDNVRVNGTIDTDNIEGTAVVTSGTSTSDTKVYSAKRSDELYYNLASGEEIQSGETWAAADNKIATTAAIDARIIDLVDDVGGFVPIANETSFPNANPDVNNGAGTLVSIKALGSNLTSNGSGVATITNGTVGNSTVTITGLANSTTYAATFGMIVETTSTLNTYSFHRQVPKATEVTTVAGSISNVNTVAGAISNVNAVAGNATNINAVAADASDIGVVAGKATEIGRLGTADAVADLALLGTADVVSDLNTLATSDIVSDMNALAVSGVLSDMDTCATNISNINTTAGAISNVNTTAGSIANVNTVASNMGTVNDFAARYRTGANNPTSSLDEGDLFFNTTANELKVYNGSAWQGGVTATGNFAVVTGNTFTGDNIYNDSVKGKFGTDSDLQIYHSGSHAFIQNSTGSLIFESGTTVLRSGSQENYLVGTLNGSVDLYYDNVKKFETTSTGCKSSFAGGNVFKIGSTDASGATLVLDGDSNGDGSGADYCYIEHGTDGDLAIHADNPAGDSQFELYVGSGSTTAIIAQAAGEVQLYYNGSEKLNTTNTGIAITNNAAFPDNGKAIFGATDDFQIYHNGSDRNFLESHGGHEIHINKGTSESCAKFKPDGSVELYYDNSKKLDTLAGGVQVHGNLYQHDNAKAVYGTSDDFEIYSSGTGAKLHCNTGVLEIEGDSVQIWNHAANEAMAKFTADAGVELYHNNSKKLETVSGGVVVTGELNCDNLYLGDSETIHLGASDDLKLWHSGSHSFIRDSGTGTLRIEASEVGILNADGTETMAQFVPGGASSLRYAGSTKLATFDQGVNFFGSIAGDDGDEVRLGTGNDFILKHDGSNSYITNATGEISIQAKAGENSVNCQPDNTTRLFYDGSPKLRTTATGIAVDDNIDLDDGHKLQLGSSSDLQIYHDGSNGFIKNDTGNLNLRTGGTLWVDNAGGTETYIKAVENGTVELYYDNSKKFETVSGGAKVTGTLETTDTISTVGNLDMADSTSTGNNRIRLGTGDDLELYHDGTGCNIRSSSLKLEIRSNDLLLQSSGAEKYFRGIADGQVELYYNNSKKFETTADGVKVRDDGSYQLAVVRDGSATQQAGIRMVDGGDEYARLISWSGNINMGVGVGSGSYEDAVHCEKNGGVTLYCDGAQKLITTSAGANISGNMRCGSAFIEGSGEKALHIGSVDAGGAAIYFDGDSNGDWSGSDYSWIKHDTGGDMVIAADNPNNDANVVLRTANGTENSIICQANSSVELYFDTSKKFETTSTGGELTGRLAIGSTSQLVNESAITATSGGNTACFRATGAAGHNPLMIWNNHTSGDRSQIQFADGSSYTSRGSITTNGSNVSYGGTSDYRLKQDDVLITDGITKVKALKPKRFKWKDNLSIGICDGFFAHEVQETAPTSGATIGAKDAVDSDGNPVYQTVDQAKLVPLLTAALQEAISKIETLETKVAALESS